MVNRGQKEQFWREMTSLWLKKWKIICRSGHFSTSGKHLAGKFKGEMARENPFLGSRGDAKTPVLTYRSQFLGDNFWRGKFGFSALKSRIFNMFWMEKKSKKLRTWLSTWKHFTFFAAKHRNLLWPRRQNLTFSSPIAWLNGVWPATKKVKVCRSQIAYRNSVFRLWKK